VIQEPPSWWMEGVCSQFDPDLFHPNKGKMEKDRDPRLVCQVCPVQHECLEWALETNQQWGVWGGKTERERRTIRKARKDAMGNGNGGNGDAGEMRPEFREGLKQDIVQGMKAQEALKDDDDNNGKDK